MKSVNWPKSGNYANITCSTISKIPYNFIFTTKFNNSSILITIISCDYFNFSLATSQYQTRLSRFQDFIDNTRTHKCVTWGHNIYTVLQLSSITKIFSRRISQSDWNIQIRLNYYPLNKLYLTIPGHIILNNWIFRFYMYNI